MRKLPTVKSIVRWFKAAFPFPTEKNISTQLGVHLEEVAEMLRVLSTDSASVHIRLVTAIQAVSGLAEYVKKHGGLMLREGDDAHAEMLDALCDQMVTAIGIAHMQDYDIDGGLNEVDRSNWSKFVEGKPIFDENLKVQKGPNYFKAKLAAFTNR